MHRSVPISILVLFFLLAGCLPAAFPEGGELWSAADVRLLRLPGDENPAQDWAAAYARLTGTDLEIRLDRLAGATGPETIQLALDFDDIPAVENTRLPFTNQVDHTPDLFITLPTDGTPLVWASPNLRPGRPAAPPLRARYLLDTLQDSLVVRISRRELPARALSASLVALRIPSGETAPVETLGPLRLDGPPPARAPLLLAFWDTLPAGTPAQALRRWDGAHTGPFGQRHGLAILLKAAQANAIPLAALDLARPPSLAGLQAVDGVGLTSAMRKAGLLILPAATYGDPAAAAKSLRAGQQAAQENGLRLDPLLYSPLPAQKELLAGPGLDGHESEALFAYTHDGAHITIWNDRRLIPLPEEPDEAAAADGLSLSARTRLLELALSSDPGDLLVLGGPLPRSPWGDLLHAGPTFSYLAAHPWIQVLDQADLQRWPAQPGAPRCADLICSSSSAGEPLSPEDDLRAVLRSALNDAPSNLFTSLAWNTYLALTEPTADPALAALQSAYLGSVTYLLEAARWAEHPAEQAGCSTDLDGDGLPECILASRTVFLILSPRGGRLAFAAARRGQDLLQMIGPRSQLVVGLGEPREWLTGQGLASDPQEIPGGFADENDPWQEYQVEIQPGTARFFLPDGSLSKTFLLQPAGFQVRLDSSRPVDTTVPLILLDALPGQRPPQPWYTFSPAPAWVDRYHETTSGSPARWGWSLENGPSISIQVDGAELSANTFNDTRDLLRQPENPDLGYPPGHFLPFPLALLTLSTPGNFTIDFTIE